MTVAEILAQILSRKLVDMTAKDKEHVLHQTLRRRSLGVRMASALPDRRFYEGKQARTFGLTEWLTDAERKALVAQEDGHKDHPRFRLFRFLAERAEAADVEPLFRVQFRGNDQYTFDLRIAAGKPGVVITPALQQLANARPDLLKNLTKDAQGRWQQRAEMIRAANPGIAAVSLADVASVVVPYVSPRETVNVSWYYAFSIELDRVRPLLEPEEASTLERFGQACRLHDLADALGLNDADPRGDDDDDDEATPSRRYWKIAPGEKARLWPGMRDQGLIAIGWDDLRPDFLLNVASRDNLHAFLRERNKDESPQTARQLWQFAQEIRPGDIIVANRGFSEIVGRGVVTGPYAHRPDRAEFHHTLPVRWFDTEPRTIEKQGGWRLTLKELSREEYEALFGADDMAPYAPDTGDPMHDLLRHLETSGLHFSHEAVSSFLLALATKRFVILTGISGTGKTRLAMAVAEHLQPVIETAVPDVELADGVTITVQPYMRKYGRIVLPVALAQQLPPGIEEISVGYATKETRLRLYRDPTGGVPALGFRGEFRKWFLEHAQVGQPIRLSLAIDETKLLVEVVEPKRIQTRLDNLRVVPVRPDWTDHRGLLGYYNPLTEKYATTDALRFVLEARNETALAETLGRPPHPFFLVLDEMNLAHVEQYFADFLSCMESGKEIPLHDHEELELGETEDATAIPRRLAIPKNLFVIGTVNVDETTYMFSPKVLDRAFTLELGDVDLLAHGSTLPVAPSGLSLRTVPPLADVEKPSTAHWTAFQKDAGQLHRAVLSLQDMLEPHGRHFGYRVANEIARFVQLAQAHGPGPESLWDAFDIALLAKILPKFHGTQQELEEVIGELLRFTEEASPRPATEADKSDKAPEPAAVRLPRTRKKLRRMKKRLKDQGFTSFII